MQDIDNGMSKYQTFDDIFSSFFHTSCNSFMHMAYERACYFFLGHFIDGEELYFERLAIDAKDEGAFEIDPVYIVILPDGVCNVQINFSFICHDLGDENKVPVIVLLGTVTISILPEECDGGGCTISDLNFIKRPYAD